MDRQRMGRAGKTLPGLAKISQILFKGFRWAFLGQNLSKLAKFLIFKSALKIIDI